MKLIRDLYKPGRTVEDLTERLGYSQTMSDRLHVLIREATAQFDEDAGYSDYQFARGAALAANLVASAIRGNLPACRNSNEILQLVTILAVLDGMMASQIIVDARAREGSEPT